jgi:hypothetical protein
MPTKPTFTMRDRQGKPFGDPIKYTPLIVIAGTQVHQFALHKMHGAWMVSHPASGARVCDVRATYRGVPVSSSGQPLAWARKAAMAQIDHMIESIGSDRFNWRIEQVTPKHETRTDAVMAV